MTHDELQRILDDHKKWINCEGGERANLSGANLYGANLYGSDLSGVNLSWANLSWSNLSEADLSEADLSEADLSWSDLYGANLSGANLFGTCIDPTNAPNADVDQFDRHGDFVVGYRTRKAGHIDKYRDCRFYSADWFSVADTECHPGLYLWPTLQQARDWAPGLEIIKVRTKASEVHHARSKWRCRWFYVVGAAKEMEG